MFAPTMAPTFEQVAYARGRKVSELVGRLVSLSDRELLELAAKAARIKIDKSETNGGGRGNTGFDVVGNAVLDWHNGKTWNPLTDDGDALRLAVKLDMFVTREGFERFQAFYSDEIRRDGKPTAATRRAIVTIAALEGMLT